MPGAHHVAAQILAGAHQIAPRLKLCSRHHQCSQLAGSVQPGELERVAVSVLIRSPGWRAIAPGEQTITSIRAARANPSPVGPAS
jgi:hypothetical protein